MADSSSSLCGCGLPFKELLKLHGLIDEAFFSSKIGVVHSGIMLDPAETYLSHDNSGLKEYGVIQNNLNELLIMGVLKKDRCFNNEILRKITSCMENIFKTKLIIKTEFVKSIPSISKYKRRIFINNLKNR